MPIGRAEARSWADLLPDEPRWVDTRGLLLCWPGTVIAGAAADAPPEVLAQPPDADAAAADLTVGANPLEIPTLDEWGCSSSPASS